MTNYTDRTTEAEVKYTVELCVELFPDLGYRPTGLAF